MTTSITTNLTKLETIKAEVKNHAMASKFTETASHYVVYYPFGMYPNGAQAHKGAGKIVALERLLNVMERHWLSNGVV